MCKLIRLFILFFLLPAFITSCNSSTDGGGTGGGDGGGGGSVTFGLQDAFPGITFDRPVDFQNAGDGTNRVFLVEQKGVIEVVGSLSAVSGTGNSGKSVVKQEDINEFLNIQDRVLFDGGERGLLGLAFDPDFQNNGLFYVDYTADNPNRTVISRFSVKESNPSQADPESELILLEFDQPSDHHKGGQVAFGPDDGFLYIAVGDGGASSYAAQDPSSLLGSILRIDVSHTEDGMNYAIPPDNPFAGNNSGFRKEIFAYGFRNPWRFSFDDANGRLYVGDVGEDRMEEIDVVENGKNYGWNIMEGSLCITPPTGCDTSGLELPILDYGRDEGGTIIAGRVYRGSISELFGKFIYGDFLSGTIWALSYNGSIVTDNKLIVDTDNLPITAFGRDENGEIFVTSLGGTTYRLVRE
jgi:Glucose / Sorbosone dehydrogenase